MKPLIVLCVWVLVHPWFPMGEKETRAWTRFWNRNVWIGEMAGSEAECRDVLRIKMATEVVRFEDSTGKPFRGLSPSYIYSYNAWSQAKCVPAEMIDKLGVTVRYQGY